MKYLSEYRDAELVARYLDEIKRTVTRPWTIMEICGGQTRSLVKNGILQLLPKEIQMVGAWSRVSSLCNAASPDR